LIIAIFVVLPSLPTDGPNQSVEISYSTYCMPKMIDNFVFELPHSCHHHHRSSLSSSSSIIIIIIIIIPPPPPSHHHHHHHHHQQLNSY
jgi:hypothetical protein